MTPRAPLSQEQVGMVHKINLKFAEQAMPVVKGTESTKSKVSEVKGFDKQRTEELKVFLSPEQMRQVRQVQAENRKMMKQEDYEKNL